MDCVFCGIVAGKIPGDILYQDEEVRAFRDIHPQAPVHLLIIPKRHIQSLAHLAPGDLSLVVSMIKVANHLAIQEGVADGYRLVINTGTKAGQVVPHLHMHLLGGRRMR